MCIRAPTSESTTLGPSGFIQRKSFATVSIVAREPPGDCDIRREWLTPGAPIVKLAYPSRRQTSLSKSVSGSGSRGRDARHILPVYYANLDPRRASHIMPCPASCFVSGSSRASRASVRLDPLLPVFGAPVLAAHLGMDWLPPGTKAACLSYSCSWTCILIDAFRPRDAYDLLEDPARFIALTALETSPLFALQDTVQERGYSDTPHASFIWERS
ncbi:hypothetical protein B0H17DRAFT_1213956 [Mycena rosella]|uniref:Uncharacterized protein n=1 Tax=Mycena rosella TaxID=1033263 RepID=A0AAD7CP16_MYCRO|nr:hypothetical protein B0H17DRAFT_1213956 [Mycena rosella]